MQTNSSNYWTGLASDLTTLAVDYGRSRLIDVETRDDDRNIPDQADLRYGYRGQVSNGLSVGVIAAGALVLVIGVWFVAKKL
jgi:hypothetical protein